MSSGRGCIISVTMDEDLRSIDSLPPSCKQKQPPERTVTKENNVENRRCWSPAKISSILSVSSRLILVGSQKMLHHHQFHSHQRHLDTHRKKADGWRMASSTSSFFQCVHKQAQAQHIRVKWSFWPPHQGETEFLYFPSEKRSF